jgi:galactose-1-phosphate uridylyltransferase
MINKTQIEQGLIEEMGLSDLPEEKQQELVSKMFEVVLKRIYVEANERLSEENRKALDEMISKDVQPEEVEKFLQEKIPDYSEMINNILAGFKDEMLKI